MALGLSSDALSDPLHTFLIGVTGERLTQVTCIGWGNDSQFLKDNQYGNPFWNETALFKTDKGNAFRAAIYWYGAHGGCERAQWYGDKMSFFMPTANGAPAIIRRTSGQKVKDDGGFERQLAEIERYQVPEYWKTDLPEPMRLYVGHDGAEPFLTHEFVDALVHNRAPAIDVYEALAYTVPGIIGAVKVTVPCWRRVHSEEARPEAHRGDPNPIDL